MRREAPAVVPDPRRRTHSVMFMFIALKWKVFFPLFTAPQYSVTPLK